MDARLKIRHVERQMVDAAARLIQEILPGGSPAVGLDEFQLDAAQVKKGHFAVRLRRRLPHVLAAGDFVIAPVAGGGHRRAQHCSVAALHLLHIFADHRHLAGDGRSKNRFHVAFFPSVL